MEYKGLNDNKVTLDLGISVGTIGKSRKEGRDLSDKSIELILNKYQDLDKIWLLAGEGNMLRDNFSYSIKDESKEMPPRKLIPFYDDVSSIGGTNMIANMESVSSASDYIDTGDWFKDATAAIRHYGESMIEYPSGCIIAIKEVLDKRLIIPGRDYVIETSEFRVTKKVQLMKDCIRAHSTNLEKYEDGTLIHQPFDIPFKLIEHISLVLGYVVKKNGGTVVFSNKNN